MEFSIQSIQTVAGCDALILMFNKEKADHEFRKLSLTRQYESLSENSSEDNAELTRISNELATITSIIGTLEPGEYQTDLISKKMKLESKKFDLENKVADYDIKAKFEKENDITNVESMITNAEAVLAALATRRSELSS
ncbi:MAG: hypothetical protein IPP69_11510 [Flavobacteriales bacterium]|nr:hypothetical protein [Flavobacteriales bacterium]